MEIQGRIKTIFDTQNVSDRFKKREVIIITEGNTPYPQYLLCQLTQDKCGLLDSMKEGDEVKAQINLRGRLWNGPQGEKCFVTIEIWSLEKIGEGPVSTNATPSGSKPTFTANDIESDLPF